MPPESGESVAQVTLCDVTLRDGMQIVNRHGVIPLEDRVRLLETLAGSGLPYLEVGSFVSPRVIRSMRDTPELLERMPPYDGQVAVLVPNLRYYQQLSALEPRRVDTVALFVSASESYSQANTKMTKEKAFAAAREVAVAARGDGFRLRGYLSCVFRDLDGEGTPMDPEVVRRDCEELLDMGCSLISLSDTDGSATPHDLERVVGYLAERLGVEPLGAHLHDRFGLGIVNALVAYRLGIRVFDSSVGGVGGSKAVKHSVGNIATEELVALFEGIGVETGVDPEALADAGEIVYTMTQMVGDPAPPSKVLANRVRVRDTPLAHRIRSIGKLVQMVAAEVAREDSSGRDLGRRVLGIVRSKLGALTRPVH